MKAVVAVTLGGIVIFVSYVLFFLGAFKTVELKVDEVGPLRLLYIEHVGPYFKIVSKIEEVESWVKHSGGNEKCEKSFGEYIDDPNMVEEDRLHSLGGCLVEQEPTGHPSEYKFTEIPRHQYLIASFSGAPSIGPYKVYPKAARWIENNGYKQTAPIIEVYQVISDRNVKTQFLFPIEKK